MPFPSTNFFRFLLSANRPTALTRSALLASLGSNGSLSQLVSMWQQTDGDDGLSLDPNAVDLIDMLPLEDLEDVTNPLDECSDAHVQQDPDPLRVLAPRVPLGQMGVSTAARVIPLLPLAQGLDISEPLEELRDRCEAQLVADGAPDSEQANMRAAKEMHLLLIRREALVRQGLVHEGNHIRVPPDESKIDIQFVNHAGPRASQAATVNVPGPASGYLYPGQGTHPGDALLKLNGSPKADHPRMTVAIWRVVRLKASPLTGVLKLDGKDWSAIFEHYEPKVVVVTQVPKRPKRQRSAASVSDDASTCTSTGAIPSVTPLCERVERLEAQVMSLEGTVQAQLLPLPASQQSHPQSVLDVSHPFSCALREANVDAIRNMLSIEPQLACAYISKPGWDPAPFRWPALSEVLSRVEVRPTRAQSIVRLLLEHGARAEARDSRAATPLHQAATRGNLPALEALLEAPGADEALWAQTKGAWLPIHNASHNGREAACKRLYAMMICDRSRGEASVAIDQSEWPTPARCNTAELDRVIKDWRPHEVGQA